MDKNPTIKSAIEIAIMEITQREPWQGALSVRDLQRINTPIFADYLNESVLKPVSDAIEILGDNKLAHKVAAADPYPDKRMTATIAMWLKKKYMLRPDEHYEDIVKFKELRAKLKDLRVPVTNPERTKRVKELLKFDPTSAEQPSDIQSWNTEVSKILDPNKDMSDEGLEVVGRHNGYTMYKMNKKSDCKVPIVKNSMSWCVTKSHFGSYGGPPYYPVVRDSDKSPFAMIIPAYFEEDPDQAVRNGNNSGRLSTEDLRKIKPLVQIALQNVSSNRQYLKSIMSNNVVLPNEVPKDIHEIIKLMKEYALLPGEWPEAEDAIVKNAEWSYEYAKEIIKGPFPKGEDAIAKDAQYSYYYARDVIKGPFPKGEDAIAKYERRSYEYAKDVIKEPFPKGEDVIAKDAEYSYYYATDVIKGPFLKGEDVIAKDAKYSYHYAKDVIRGPFPKGEDAIVKNAQYSYYYATNVIKRPSPKWEDAIAKDAEWSCRYALNVIKRPFPKGEDAIAKDGWWSYLYAKDVIRGPFPKGEDAIAKDPEYFQKYAKYVIKGPWPKRDDVHK